MMSHVYTHNWHVYTPMSKRNQFPNRGELRSHIDLDWGLVAPGFHDQVQESQEIEQSPGAPGSPQHCHHEEVLQLVWTLRYA